MSLLKKLLSDKDEAQDDQFWIFAYADMMSLLLGFFVIMYSFSEIDDKKFDALSKEISSQFQGGENESKEEEEVINVETSITTLNRLVELLEFENKQQLHQSVKKAIKSKSYNRRVFTKLNPMLGGEGTISIGPKESPYKEIVLPESILFSAGSHKVSKAAKIKITLLTQKILELGHIDKIEVEGHTDSTKPGRNHPLKDNFTIAAARAGAVAKVLINNGVEKNKISVKGMADLRPLVPEKTALGQVKPENRRKNRRVHIRLFKKDLK